MRSLALSFFLRMAAPSVPGTSPKARLLVHPAMAGERLDVFLAGNCSVSRRRLRRWIGEGAVLVNGRALRIASRPMKAGDVVDLLRPAEETGLPPAPSLDPVTIIHLDDWIAALDKPAGILSQPIRSAGEREMALDETFLLHLAMEAGRRPYLHLAHRLDRVTSGLLLFSLRPKATSTLAEAWREGLVERRYTAIVEGSPSFQETLIDAPIARGSGKAWRFRVAPQGKAARTEVQVLESWRGGALVSCRLVTGRTHQVRVHLSHVGLPVLGDTLYGGHRSLAAAPLLHASSLSFPHPRDGVRIHLEAPLPRAFDDARVE